MVLIYVVTLIKILDFLEPVKIINTTYKNNYDKNVLVFNPGDEFKLLPYGYMSNKYNIGLWFWELNELPKTWIKNSELFDEVWASTDYLMDVFKRSIPDRVKVKKITFPIEKPFNINENDFLCLFVFDYFSDVNRKNPFAVIQTFMKSFPGYKNCKLIIKTQNGEEKDIEEIEKLINGDNRITHINETFDLKKINTLMNASDVYISLHRSEGFGLTIMESILLEKPVICTNYSGNLDFCKKEWCELVDYKLIPVTSELYKNIYDGDKDLYWADPIVEDAKIKLLKIYNDISHYEKIAKIGKEWILKNYNSNNFKSQIEEHLKK
jgi:glycosyltransferase involved in cell wall biosynthesis